jgi:hypothetical protein
MIRRDLGRHVNARLGFYGSTGLELLARLALALRTVRKPFTQMKPSNYDTPCVKVKVRFRAST